MMFLSKVVLQGGRDAYQWHRLLWGLFNDRPDSERPFLFRCERQMRGAVEALMQSTLEPASRSEHVTVLASKPFDPRPQPGQMLRLRLTANPVRTIRDESGRLNGRGEVKSCRVPLLQEDQQLDWLVGKLSAAAEVHEARVNARQPLYFRKGGRAGKIVQVTFDGLVKVREPAVLRELMGHGVGPAKAFGCGLLTIARA